MNIQQLRESQRTQIESLGKWTPIMVYMPLSVEEAANVVQHGNSGKTDNIVTTSYKIASRMGDVVIPMQVDGEHIEIPESLSTPENVRRAHELYPKSHDPLISMVLLSDKPVVYFTGNIQPDNINELFITGYDSAGNRVDPGSERIEYPSKSYLKWYVANIVVPTKRKRLQK